MVKYFILYKTNIFHFWNFYACCHACRQFIFIIYSLLPSNFVMRAMLKNVHNLYFFLMFSRLYGSSNYFWSIKIIEYKYFFDTGPLSRSACRVSCIRYFFSFIAKDAINSHRKFYSIFGSSKKFVSLAELRFFKKHFIVNKVYHIYCIVLNVLCVCVYIYIYIY